MQPGVRPEVDVLVLSAHRGPLRAEVRHGLAQQHQVRCHVHRVFGTPRPGDANRYETIARARNQARTLGRAPWALFLDDDVVLGPDCIARLLAALQERPDWGAMAADYLGQSAGRDHVGHVAMGATLFRRSVLEQVHFRWESSKCECRCCCEDLARRGIRIGYLPGAVARHLPKAPAAGSSGTPSGGAADEPQVMAALNSLHFELFVRQFLRTWKATGNTLGVTVLGYGLSRSEQETLHRHPLVADLAWFPSGSLSPSVQRVRDFQTVLSRWPAHTPVAWWDAGDVLFQRTVAELWPIVRAHPDRLLAVAEPTGYPHNPALGMWLETFPDGDQRLDVYHRLENRPQLNGGFAAGTVGVLQRYLPFAQRFLRDTHMLWQPWSDQIPLNYYCHSFPDRWMAIDETWNFCLAFRHPRILQKRRPGDPDWHPDLAPLPRFVTSAGRFANVVHGNGYSLRTLLAGWRSLQGDG